MANQILLADNISTELYYLSRAKEKTAADAGSRLVWYWDDVIDSVFVGNQWGESNTGSPGKYTPSNLACIGGLEIRSGDAAAYRRYLFASTYGSGPFIATAGATAKWYMATRACLSNDSGGHANHRAGIALRYTDGSFNDTEICARLGINGGISLTKYSFDCLGLNSGTAGTLTSTVSIDYLVYHVFEAWSDGSGTVYMSVDGETPVSGTMNNNRALSPLLYNYNVSGLGTLYAAYDWFCFASKDIR